MAYPGLSGEWDAMRSPTHSSPPWLQKKIHHQQRCPTQGVLPNRPCKEPTLESSLQARRPPATRPTACGCEPIYEGNCSGQNQEAVGETAPDESGTAGAEQEKGTKKRIDEMGAAYD